MDADGGATRAAFTALLLVLGTLLWRGTRGSPAEKEINPYEVGGFASLFIPLVQRLNELEKEPGTPGWVFRVLNQLDLRLYATIGWRLVPLAEVELCELAGSLDKVCAADHTAHAVKLLCAEIERPPCSATGRLVVYQWVRGLLHVRRACQDFVKRHPEIHQIKIEQPLFIIGPPRTASSFLLRLLSQDPNFRCPKFWEINAPLPPPEEATYATDRRIQQAEAGLDSFNTISPTLLKTIRKFHAFGADEYEEDSLLLSYSFCFGMYFHMSPDPVSPFAQWMFNAVDKEAAYLLHKQMIQLLSMRYKPKSCWLLKAPLHSFYPEVLLKTYPDARIIVTHRDHLEAVPSWTKFVLAHMNVCAGAILC